MADCGVVSVYLVAILDWFSRYVLAWEISITLDTSFCSSALDWALEKATPEIFNSDQGAQFTSNEFTTRLENAGILISMDGIVTRAGQCVHGTTLADRKYEEVYLNEMDPEPYSRGTGRSFETHRASTPSELRR